MLLFILPLTLPIIGLNDSAVVICAVATFAAVQEGHYIRTGREVSNAYLDDFLDVLDEYDIPWCRWSFWSPMGLFNTRAADAGSEKYGPYYLDTKRYVILKKHMS